MEFWQPVVLYIIVALSYVSFKDHKFTGQNVYGIRKSGSFMCGYSSITSCFTAAFAFNITVSWYCYKNDMDFLLAFFCCSEYLFLLNNWLFYCYHFILFLLLFLKANNQNSMCQWKIFKTTQFKVFKFRNIK